MPPSDPSFGPSSDLSLEPPSDSSHSDLPRLGPLSDPLKPSLVPPWGFPENPPWSLRQKPFWASVRPFLLPPSELPWVVPKPPFWEFSWNPLWDVPQILPLVPLLRRFSDPFKGSPSDPLGASLKPILGTFLRFLLGLPLDPSLGHPTNLTLGSQTTTLDLPCYLPYIFPWSFRLRAFFWPPFGPVLVLGPVRPIPDPPLGRPF